MNDEFNPSSTSVNDERMREFLNTCTAGAVEPNSFLVGNVGMDTNGEVAKHPDDIAYTAVMMTFLIDDGDDVRVLPIRLPATAVFSMVGALKACLPDELQDIIERATTGDLNRDVDAETLARLSDAEGINTSIETATGFGFAPVYESDEVREHRLAHRNDTPGTGEVKDNG